MITPLSAQFVICRLYQIWNLHLHPIWTEEK